MNRPRRDRLRHPDGLACDFVYVKEVRIVDESNLPNYRLRGSLHSRSDCRGLGPVMPASAERKVGIPLSRSEADGLFSTA